MVSYILDKVGTVGYISIKFIIQKGKLMIITISVCLFLNGTYSFKKDMPKFKNHELDIQTMYTRCKKSSLPVLAESEWVQVHCCYCSLLPGCWLLSTLMHWLSRMQSHHHQVRQMSVK